MWTTEPVFALRQLQEKCGDINSDVYMAIVNLENPYNGRPYTKWSDTMAREQEWSATRHAQDMEYKVITQKGQTIFPDRCWITPMSSPGS